MNSGWNQTLSSVAEDTLAAMAFLFVVGDDEQINVPTSPEATSAVTFSGPSSGGLVLTVPEGMLPVLAANILGMSDGETPRPEQGRDALLELLNVICGNLLPKITSPKDVFHVDEPHIVTPQEAENVFSDSTLRAKVRLRLECGLADLSLFVDQPTGAPTMLGSVRSPRVRPTEVLIADDDGVLRHMLTHTLKRFGYSPVVVMDGRQAWELLQKPNAPKLLILDWLMPGVAGIDLCRMVRQRGDDIAPFIILLTGLSNKRELVKGLEAGADDCMTKSFHTQELMAKIRIGERIIRLEVELRAVKNALKRELLPQINETSDGVPGNLV